MIILFHLKSNYTVYFASVMIYFAHKYKKYNILVHSGTLPAYPYMIKLYERPSGLYSSDSHEEIDLYPVKNK